MRGRTAVWMVATLALMSTASASHDVGMLDAAGLKKHAAQNKALARYLKYNGMPEMAEVKPIIDQPPWDDHEVTLYYLEVHKEISFARARALGRPDVYIARYQRTLTDADVRALKSHGTLLASTSAAAVDGGTPGACNGNAAERAECAATRAENAANRIDVAAVKAEKAADRTEAIAEKMTAPVRKTSTHRHAATKNASTKDASATDKADKDAAKKPGATAAKPAEQEPGSAS